MMKIAIYTPYLDTAGGGEKYFLTIAELLSKNEQVDILLDQHLSSLDISRIKTMNEQRHGLNLSKVNFIPAPLGIKSKFIQRIFFLLQYDWFFYLTDGSIFLPTAKHNIVHFQVPFTNTKVEGLKGLLKLKFWKEAIYNSFFTKEIVEKSWPLKGQVIYPPVSIERFKGKPKKKQIISVGRFQASVKSKKHELMIEVFKQLALKKSSGWSLHLAGGVSKGDEDYLIQLQNSAKGYPVFFYPNIALNVLIELYGVASIYWHAKGYGSDDPKDFEHFAVTTVEAMAAGCVLVVINKGGQKEILEEGKSGFLWYDLDQFKNKTMDLINDQKMMTAMGKNAVIRSKLFSKEIFENKIKQLIYGKH